MFAGFMVVAALQISAGVLLVSRRPSKRLIVALLALTLGSIGAWLLSRTNGLPYLEDQEPIGFKDGITKLFEVASIPALLLLLSPELARVSLPSRRLGSQTLTVVGSVCSLLMIPALVIGGNPHESHSSGVHAADHQAGDVHQLAQAHEGSTHKKHSGGEHASNRSAHEHSTSATSPAQHDHSATQLASAPFHAGHEDTGDAPTHHGGGNGGHHRSEQHPKRHRDHGGNKNHHPSGGHGNGEHGGGHGDHGGGSDDEEAITVTYEPSPSVCVALANACFP
jgi:hypothetical protein